MSEILYYDKTCPIIDIHCHGGLYRAFNVHRGDAVGMIQEMDACGVDLAVVSAHQAISADYRAGNDLSIKWARQHPGRLWAYAVVNPNYPRDVLPELQRCFASGVVRGIKIHSELSGDYPMDGPGYRPMWEFAADNKIPVLFHTYFGGDRLEVIDHLAGQYPSATLLMGHCAVDLGLERAVQLAKRHRNIVMDVTGPQSVPGVVEYLVSEVGSAQVVFGSDMPFIDLGTLLGPVIHANLAATDREAVLWGTAAHILGLRHDAVEKWSKVT